MKQNEILCKQRGARIRIGIGHEETSYVYPPPSTFCYSPIPKPHPSNDLIVENTNSLFAGLEGVSRKGVREECGYGGTSGLGCINSSSSLSFKKFVLDNDNIISDTSSNIEASVLNNYYDLVALNDVNLSISKNDTMVSHKNCFEKLTNSNFYTYSLI